jgi:hypothetical protein
MPTLVEKIIEDLNSGKDARKIRRELLHQYPKQVVEDAINEAEWKRQEQGGQRFDATMLASHDADANIILDENVEEKKSVSPIFFFLVFIIIIWVGIAVSFNLAHSFDFADSFGKAVQVTPPATDLTFTTFCLHTIQSTVFSDEEICEVGQDAYNAGKINEDDLKKECLQLTYDVQRRDKCAKSLADVMDAFTS